MLYACFRTHGFLRIFAYITLFISIIAIFFLGARASYLSLIAIVSLIGVGQLVLYRKELSADKRPLYQSLTLFGVFVAGFLISNIILTKYASESLPQVEDEIVASDEPSESYIEGRLG